MDNISQLEDPKMFKLAFMNALESGNNEEFEKFASQGSTDFIRRNLREDSFCHAIIPFEEITNSDLAESVKTEDPFVIYEMEAAQAMPHVVAFNDTTRQQQFFGDKFIMSFFTLATPVWMKNVNKLRTYKMDIKSVLVDNALRDLSRLRDVRFMEGVNEITGIIPGAPSPITGMQQYVQLHGRLDRQNWVSTMNYLPSRTLLNGVFLCNHVTWSEFARWGRDEMGGDKAQAIIEKGNGAWDKASMSGIDFIVTLKHDLVPNGKIYQFAPPNYLGKAGVLEKPTMYVKKDKDIISMTCREIIGMTIANSPAVQAVEYDAVTGPYGGDGRVLAKA